MARPKTPELTDRELELMHVFWERGELSIAQLQQHLDETGRKLAYTTVATLVRILCEKNYVKQLSQQRPHRFKPRRSFQDVSGRFVKDLVQRVFSGSREALLVRLIEDRKLSEAEREMLRRIVEEGSSEPNKE